MCLLKIGCNIIGVVLSITCLALFAVGFSSQNFLNFNYSDQKTEYKTKYEGGIYAGCIYLPSENITSCFRELAYLYSGSIINPLTESENNLQEVINMISINPNNFTRVSKFGNIIGFQYVNFFEFIYDSSASVLSNILKIMSLAVIIMLLSRIVIFTPLNCFLPLFSIFSNVIIHSGWVVSIVVMSIITIYIRSDLAGLHKQSTPANQHLKNEVNNGLFKSNLSPYRYNNINQPNADENSLTYGGSFVISWVGVINGLLAVIAFNFA